MYCLMLWHFCNVTDACEVEKVQENTLSLIFDDYCESAIMLIACNRHQKTHLYIGRLKHIVQEFFKTNNLSPAFLNELFTKKMVP